jgi:hypothetical protein
MICLAGLVAPLSAQPSLRLETLSGEASLSRPDGQAWPLEEGQRMLLGDKLTLPPKAQVEFRYLKRVRLRVDGPATLQVKELVEPAGSDGGDAGDEGAVPRLVLEVSGGWLAVDSRFQFERAMDLHVGRPGQTVQVPSGARWLLGEDARGRALYGLMDGSTLVHAQAGKKGLTPEKKQKEKIVEEFPRGPRLWLDGAQSMLVLARDFDRDSGKWPRPPVLGPALVRELGAAYPRQLTLVDGSGGTYLARTANHAIKTGDDTWLRTLGLKMGAQWILVGNLVVRDPGLNNELASSYNPPVFQARAEARLIESFPGGDILVSDASNTTVARVGRPRHASRRLALDSAAEELAGHLKYHFGELFMGRSHSQTLMSFSFQNVTAASLPKLKRALGALDSVQRMFSRRFAGGIFKVDLVPRRDAQHLAGQVARLNMPGFSLTDGGLDAAGARVYTLGEP